MVVLSLYVCGDTPRSQRAIHRLKEMLGDRQDCRVEVIDVIQRPEAAEAARILATPALIKESPPPVRRIVGDLTEAAVVLELLELPLLPRQVRV
jgi:circadian clock protein KaiB